MPSPHLLICTAAAVAILSALAPSASAETILFDDGMVSTIGAPSPDIEVRDSVEAAPTTVNVGPAGRVGFALNPDGTIMTAPVLDPDTMEPVLDPDTMQPVVTPVISNEGQSVAVFGSSSVNLTGGETADSFVGNGTSVSSITNATIGDDILVNDSAQITINGTTTADDLLAVNGTVIMNGGSVDTVELSGTATFAFFGGRVDDIGDDDAGTGGAGNSLTFIGAGATVDDDAFFFGSGRLISAGGQFDDELQFFDNSSAVLVSGNVDDDLVVADNAEVTIQSFTVGDTIEAEGNSTTTIQDGVFGAIEAFESSTITIEGGAIEGGAVAGGPSTLNFLGGVLNGGLNASLGASVLFGEDFSAEELSVEVSTNAEVEVDGSSLGDVDILAAAADVTIDADQIADLSVSANLGSTVSIEGGLIESANLLALTNSTIEILGVDFLVNGVSFDEGGEIPFVAGTISGRLSDGSPFAATFTRQFSPLNQVGTIRLLIVPEPSTALLMAGLAMVGAGGRRAGRGS